MSKKNKNIFLSLIIGCLIFIIVFTQNITTSRSIPTNNLVSKCTDLSFEESQFLKSENFGTIEIKLDIQDQRKWKKSILENMISFLEKGSNTNRRSVEANLIIKKNEKECFLKSKIRGHGDQIDHYLNHEKGYRFIYDLPSLRVKLLEGHIFGITDFLLLRPETRIDKGEIFITTLFNSLGLFSPRTSFAKIDYNQKVYNFLFQEKIDKEFLEKNKLIEGPIFKGDERFLFRYRLEKVNSISKHKLENKNWSNKNSIHQQIAKEGLDILNIVNFFYSSKFSRTMIVDYYTSTKNTSFHKYFSRMPIFDSLMYAMRATHGLDVDNRRMYYDSLNEEFIPIYYNGTARILLKEKNYKYSNLFKNNILKSAKIGSSGSLLLIENINLKEFKNSLSKRGLILSTKEINKIFYQIKNNLKMLNKLKEKNLIIPSNNNQDNLINNVIYNEGIQIKFLFSLKNDYLLCDLLLKNCKDIKLTRNEISKAIAQELKIDKFNIIYFAPINSLKNKKYLNEVILDKNKIKEQKVDLQNNLKFYIYGDIEYEVNYKNKEILFKKKDNLSNIVFNNTNIINWKIKIIDQTQNTEKFNTRDTKNLSGCINFYNSEIKDLELLIYNAKCEDAANFVNSKGKIKNIKIFNSAYDSLDFDFSNFEIEKIQIKKSGNDCLDLSYGNYNINELITNTCIDKAISVGENSIVKINKFTNLNSKNAIVSKDFSNLKINQAIIKYTDICVSAYSKKQEFSGALVHIDNLLCENYNQIIYHDISSKIIINN